MLAATGLACRDMGNNFSKALLSARCIAEFKEALTPEVMEPIMALQGSPLGFRTDKDSQGGYPLAVVKEAVIAAAMMGVMPVGNQMNLIGGRPYITKEGFQFLLGKIESLGYDIELGVPVMKNGGALVHTIVRWWNRATPKAKETHESDIPVRVNSGMGADAILGKATRKASAWLYAKVTNNPLPDADAEEAGMDMSYAASTAPAQNGTRSRLKPAPGRVVEEEQQPAPVAEVQEQQPEAVAPATPEEEAALDWFTRSLQASGATFNKAYKALDAAGHFRPKDGSPRPVVARWCKELKEDAEAREVLEQSGVVFEK